jgi:hypothetical protein
MRTQHSRKHTLPSKPSWNSKDEKKLTDLRGRVEQLRTLQKSLEQQYPEADTAHIDTEIRTAEKEIVQLELVKLQSGWAILPKY